MGTRDFRWRESKKAKKGAKQVSPISILPPQESVQIIKKAKKKHAEEESQ